MHFIIAGTLAAFLVTTVAPVGAEEAVQPATLPVEKTTTTRAGHDIAPLPGGKVAPVSQSDKDNVNKAIDYFEKKLRPSRRKKAAPKNIEAPAAVTAPTAK